LEKVKTMEKFYASVILSLFLFFSFCPASAQEGPHVEIFSPQGVVKGVRQVTARFSEQIVPFGDPRLVEPFDIKCPEKGQTRWADAKNWIYDFDRDLPAGVKCEFALKTGLKTLAGSPVSGQQQFFFSTGGPAIKISYPPEGSGIDEDQAFMLLLDAEATEESVLANASCAVEGINERIGVKIVKGEERENIIRNNLDNSNKDLPNVIVQCRQNFPNDSNVNLVWGRGISSMSGVQTTEDRILPFKARGPFTATFNCEKENANADCVPILPVRLDFSSPVPLDMAAKIVLHGQGKTYKPEKISPGADYGEEEGEAEDIDQEDDNFVNGVSFKGPFPEKSAFVIEVPKDLKDDAGRTLANRDKFPLTVRTDSYPPLAKFSALFGIIELRGDAVLPVTLRNLEPEVRTRMLKVEGVKGAVDEAKEGATDKAVKSGETISPAIPGPLDSKTAEAEAGVKGRLRKIRLDREAKVIDWMKKVLAAGREKAVLKNEQDVKEFYLPKPGGPKAFEVVGIPLKEAGFYVVELESRILGTSLLGQRKPMFVPTAALVTNLSAHFKWGRESSLVWVTTLDKAEPVKAASVSARDCKGKVIWQGKTDENGIARTNKRFPSLQELPHCPGLDGGLFIFARTNNDMTFVHSSWEKGIEPFRYNLPNADYRGPAIAHTVFDRTLLRAGETSHMKHIIRKHTTTGFSLLKNNDLPKAVLIYHQGSNQRYEFPIKWDPKGTAETTWQIPRDAKLGNYSVVLLKKATERPKVRSAAGGNEEGDEAYFSPDGWDSGSFRVEEFRVPLMKGIIQPPKEQLVNPSEVEIDLFVSHLSGGGANNLPVKLRSQLQPKQVRFADYEDFVFANGEVKEEITRRTNYEAAEEQQARKTQPKIQTTELILDKTGSARTRISGLPSVPAPNDIIAEMEFRDSSGEVQTVSTRIPLWRSKILLGIKPDSWASSKESFKFSVAAVDLSGMPVSDQAVKVELFQRQYYSHRKRLVGGFYSYEHVTETKRVGPLCEGKTDPGGLLICEVKSPVSGNVILQASTTDSSGNLSTASRDVWIAGKGEWWFDVADNDRIDLLPEKKRYEPGDTAKFQVRMPFRTATALITVEREGVMEAFIRKLSGKDPVIEIPVKNNYAPNVFVSALVVRGRVSDIQPTAIVDLGKPAFKLGIAEINVGWKAHELKVKVSPEKEIYKIREKARIKIIASRSDGSAPPKGSEVVVAAVDEGLLELMPNKSWNLLEEMMGRRGYEVETSTAQMQVVGKRHFGLKALPHGGGGGRQVTRELFDTLLFWKARLPLNDRGEASVEVPLNDSLTGFRIVAVATGGTGMFGSGQAGIRTTQDLMILAGVPPLVREGDTFRAGFTVRNASSRSMELDINARLKLAEERELQPLQEVLAAGEAKEIGWEIKVPYGVEALGYEINAKERAGDASDSLKAKQKVAEAVPVKVFQATVAQVDNSFAMDVEKPKDALSGKGGVNLSLRPKLSKGMDGVTWVMKRYPYSCMEQKVSKAIALRDENLWKNVLSELPSHLDKDGLVKYFPTCLLGSDVLTAYILSISNEAGWSIPADIREHMEEGLKGFIEGRIMRYSSLPTADLSIRKMASLEALSRSGKADPKLLDSIILEPALWPTSALLDWTNVLLRVQGIRERQACLKEAEQIIRSRLNFQGTSMGFSTEGTDNLWWLMLSADVNAVKSVLTFLNFDNWKQDMPRLARGALGRQYRGAWSLTTANAWGVLAMEKFSKKFESMPVTGMTSASLDNKTKTVEWGKSKDGKSFMFGWPKEKEALKLTHQGTGKPWAVIQGLAAIPLKEPYSSGYRIKKTLTPVDRKAEGRWSKGDVVRVKLELEAQADMTWVVVDDPIPAGSAILGTGLGRDSQILTTGEERKGWVFPVFEERSFEAFRAYYEFVPKGKWTVEYTVRLNNAGEFHLPATRVEALYSPEMRGETPNKQWEVAQ
jgi:alpha-2-macroglobulin